MLVLGRYPGDQFFYGEIAKLGVIKEVEICLKRILAFMNGSTNGLADGLPSGPIPKFSPNYEGIGSPRKLLHTGRELR
jgi:hypothetical protein